MRSSASYYKAVNEFLSAGIPAGYHLVQDTTNKRLLLATKSPYAAWRTTCAGATFSEVPGNTLTATIDAMTYRVECSEDLAQWIRTPTEIASPTNELPTAPSGYEYHSFKAGHRSSDRTNKRTSSWDTPSRNAPGHFLQPNENLPRLN